MRYSPTPPNESCSEPGESVAVAIGTLSRLGWADTADAVKNRNSKKCAGFVTSTSGLGRPGACRTAGLKKREMPAPVRTPASSVFSRSASELAGTVLPGLLVYAEDRDAGAKHAIARNLMADLWRSGEGVLSIQVLKEFFVDVTRKVPRPIRGRPAR